MKKNGLKSYDFFGEFSDFVGSLAISKGHLLTAGDFNSHMPPPSDVNTKHLSSILKSASLTQHVQEHTHRHGHILDLVISHKEMSVTSILFDHFLVSTEMWHMNLIISSKRKQ